MISFIFNEQLSVQFDNVTIFFQKKKEDNVTICNDFHFQKN